MAIGTAALIVASGGGLALAEPTSTPAPTPQTTVEFSPGESAASTDQCESITTSTTTTPTSATTTPAITTPAPAPNSAACAQEPAASTTQPSISTQSEAPAEQQVPASTSAASQPGASPSGKIPYTGLPTENPNSTIIPGEMRSDREELPDGYTKEEADQTEIAEAADQAKRRTSRAAVTCQRYWPVGFDVCGAIRDKYNSLGAQFSFLSFPTSGNIVNPGNTGERVTFLFTELRHAF